MGALIMASAAPHPPAPPLSAQPATTTAGDAIEKVGKWVTIFGAVITTVIGLCNFLLTLQENCAKERASQYESFRSATKSEVEYWKDLWRDYQTIYDPPQSNADARLLLGHRRAKLLAIYALAQRNPPTFAEFDVPANEKCEAQQRLTSMQVALLNSLEESAEDQQLAGIIAAQSYAGKANVPPLVSPECQKLTEEAGAPAASDAPSTQATVPAVSHPANPATTPTGAPSRGESGGSTAVPAPALPPLLELAPISKIGWDIDIFWCENDRAGAQEGLRIGQTLAAISRSGRRIAPGIALGRVRLRLLSPPDKSTPAAFTANPGIVYDNGPGEEAAAQAVNAIIASMDNPVTMALRNDATSRSRWYLSAYVCGVGRR